MPKILAEIAESAETSSGMFQKKTKKTLAGCVSKKTKKTLLTECKCFQPFAMRATDFSLYASIQIKIYNSHHRLLAESYILAREKH